MAHTKGRWSSYEDAVTAKVKARGRIDVSQVDICHMYDDDGIPRSEQRDNKKLIKAAPDMYRALQEIIDVIESGDRKVMRIILLKALMYAKAGLRKAPKRK